MLINGMLNLAIGLALTFGVVSLVMSAITEGIASFLALRSKALLAGIKQLVNDPHATGLALAVYQHAAVNPLGDGSAPTAPANWPDTKDNRPGAPTGLLRAGRQGRGQVAYRLASWFDATTARRSGDYKRKSQWMNLLIAAVLVITMDVDAISIARHVYVDPPLVGHAGLHAHTSPEAAFNAWAAISPFGWHGFAASAAGDHFMLALVWAAPRRPPDEAGVKAAPKPCDRSGQWRDSFCALTE